MPRGICELVTLRELTLEWLNELQEMPDLSGLSTLESLTIGPRGTGKLGALRELTLCRLDETIVCGSKPIGIGELPWIEALTSLHGLYLHVADYAHGSRAFTALSRSLPCLQQLQVLRLEASEQPFSDDESPSSSEKGSGEKWEL